MKVKLTLKEIKTTKIKEEKQYILKWVCELTGKVLSDNA